LNGRSGDAAIVDGDKSSSFRCHAEWGTRLSCSRTDAKNAGLGETPVQEDTNTMRPPVSGNERVDSALKSAAVTGSRWMAAIAAVVMLTVVSVAAVRAGSCRVLLAIGSVDYETLEDGVVARLSGTWEFDNLIQVSSGIDFNVLFIHEDEFVLLRYPDQAYSGTYTGLSEALDSGLDGTVLQAVEGAASSEPGARFISVEAQRMKAVVPCPTNHGLMSVVTYMVIDGDYISPVISNVLTRPFDNKPKSATLPPPSSTGTAEDGRDADEVKS